MTDFLFHLGALSLGGGLVGLVLMATGLLTRSRYAARWRCWGWLLLCLRLAIPLPFSFPNVQVRAPIQLTSPSLERPSELPFTARRPFQDAAPSPVAPTGSSSQQPDSSSPTSSSPDDTDTLTETKPTVYLSQIVTGIWILGGVGILVWNLIAHLRLKRFLKRWASPVQDFQLLPLYNAIGDELGLDRRPRLMTCPGLAAPMLAGLLHPILLLPEQPLAPKELEYALLHELTHYRQKDHIWSALRCAALALHWYNPLVWLAVALSKRDGELSCDAGAVKVLGEEERIPYGRTLVSLVAQRSLRPGDLLSCSTSMAEGKGSIQERIAQLVKRPQTKKTAFIALVCVAALAVVFTFGGGAQDRPPSRERFLSSLEDAQSVSLSLPPLSSTGYDPITDEDLLSQVRELLGQAEAWDRETSVDLSFQDVASSCCTVTFLDGNDTSAFYLYVGQGGDYVLARLDDSTAGAEPLAVLPEGTLFQLEDLFKTQLGRNQSTTRVEYPEFKNQLTQLFLGVEECVLLNQSEDYDMEEWLTKHTSFYEIIHGVPWWLKDAPEGWYARAMDAGSWYSIVIPDSMVSQVQAICEKQAQYPSFDTVYSALESTDTIQYAAMSAMSSRGIIRDPAVIDQITQLILTPQDDVAQVSDPGRVTMGEELGVLTIPLDEEHELSLCLQEVEGGCLLSCGRTDNTWSDTQPVLWTLPAGTAHKIYAIYEDWLGD